MKLKKIGVMVFLVFVTGCMFDAISSDDLRGKYKANLPDGAVEILELRAAGDCLQEIRLKGGVVLSARGSWRYDSRLRCVYLSGTRIALLPGGGLDPKLGQPLAGNTGALSVSRSVGGKVVIALGEGIDYVRM